MHHPPVVYDRKATIRAPTKEDLMKLKAFVAQHAIISSLEATTRDGVIRELVEALLQDADIADPADAKTPKPQNPKTPKPLIIIIIDALIIIIIK